MDTVQRHPSLSDLHAFAQGNLTPELMPEVEEHVAHCDICCLHLQSAPEDTLVQLARDAGTTGFCTPNTLPASAEPAAPGIPTELVDHPRYRILGLIGCGGMGAVFKAQHRLMERFVALKIINAEFLRNQAAVERFRREFRAAAKLAHPNIVTAFDAEQAGNLHFLVMEFVDGVGVDQLVKQRGPLGLRLACRLIRQAARGLQHIHEQGMVHRDIKPHNLMVSASGQLKILDCGLARLSATHSLESTEDGSEKTKIGMVLGTPDYMAPEQSIDASSADVRSDIYSLGCTFYYALSGQPPFPQGSAIKKLLAHAEQEPTPIRALRADVPPQVTKVLERMMAKDPRDRYQTPSEIVAVLTALLDGPNALLGSSAPNLQPDAIPLADSSKLPAAEPVVLPAVSDDLFAADPLGANFGNDTKTRTRPLGRAARKPFIVPITLLALVAVGLLVAIPILISRFGNDGEKSRQNTSTQESTIGSGPQQVASAALPRKVLFVIPHWGLWLADYEDVKRALQKRGIEVVTASSELAPSDLVAGSRQGTVTPDILVDQSIVAREYGAIVFAGLDMREFRPGGRLGDVVGDLLNDFQHEDRLLTAICGGQRALAAHGKLAGKKVAYSQYAEQYYVRAKPQQTRVERDGRVITAAADTDADAFAAAIAAALGG